MDTRILVCFVLAGLFQTDVRAQTATAAQSATGSPAIDAARWAAAGSDDPLRRPGTSIGGKPGGGLFNIQGGGIGLPPGVGGDQRGQPGPDSTKDEKPDQKKQTVAQPACTGVDAQGRECGQQGATDSAAQRMERGAEKNPGAAPPTATTVQGAGIGTPTCFGDSRDSGACK